MKEKRQRRTAYHRTRTSERGDDGWEGESKEEEEEIHRLGH